jgi:hypothetical protein
MRRSKHHFNFPEYHSGMASGLTGLRKSVCFVPDKLEEINETFLVFENQKILLNSNQIFFELSDDRSKSVFLSTISQN